MIISLEMLHIFCVLDLKDKIWNGAFYSVDGLYTWEKKVSVLNEVALWLAKTRGRNKVNIS